MEASPEMQLVPGETVWENIEEYLPVVGDMAISLTVKFAEEGWNGLMGIAEANGEAAVEGVEAAEAAGNVSEAIDIIMLMVAA